MCGLPASASPARAWLPRVRWSLQHCAQHGMAVLGAAAASRVTPTSAHLHHLPAALHHCPSARPPGTGLPRHTAIELLLVHGGDPMAVLAAIFP